MSAYPQPPSPPLRSADEPSASSNHWDTSDSVAPRLPSKFWLVGIATFVLLAISLQTNALVRILGASQKAAEFDAQVAAWERAGTDRQKALDTWRQLQADVDSDVKRMRDESTTLKSSVAALKAQRDQALQDASREQEVLKALETSLDIAKQDLEKTRAGIAQQKAEKNALAESKTTAETELARLANQTESENAKLQALKDSVTSQQKLFDASKLRFDDIEKRITQFEKILETRIETAAKARLEQERLTALQAERSKLQKEYDDLNQKLVLVQATVKDAESSVAESEAKRQQLEQQTVSLQKRLSELSKQETDTATKMSTMTQAMNAMASNAALSLKDLAEKAVQLKDAIAELQVTKKADPISESSESTEQGPSEEADSE